MIVATECSHARVLTRSVVEIVWAQSRRNLAPCCRPGLVWRALWNLSFPLQESIHDGWKTQLNSRTEFALDTFVMRVPALIATHKLDDDAQTALTARGTSQPQSPPRQQRFPPLEIRDPLVTLSMRQLWRPWMASRWAWEQSLAWCAWPSLRRRPTHVGSP